MTTEIPAKVLVVDDDASLLRFIAVLLKSEGFEVTAAADGSSALASLASDEPDIVILDLSMPGVDGRAFYRLARERDFLGPILICSAFGAAAAQRELGAEGFVSKPFDPDVLVSSVKKLLAGRQQNPNP